VVVLLNALRTRGVTKFPLLGLFKLGTGNGWPSAVGARRYEKELMGLPTLPLDPPSKHFQLCEVEGKVCQFAGVGWDATLLNDYRRNLENRQQQLVAGGVASNLSKGLGGYLYSLFRITVPEELQRARTGRTAVKVENIGEPALTLDAHRQRVLVPAAQTTLYEGPLSIGATGIEPYWGSKFMAFPYAMAVPGRMNFRVYDRHVLVGVNNMFKLWGGKELPGMHDWWLTGVRLHLSRPMPFQVGGDVMGTREVIDFTMAKETVDLIDWGAVKKQKHPAG
jgi:diacylglycerol kinase family enzyme